MAPSLDFKKGACFFKSICKRVESVRNITNFKPLTKRAARVNNYKGKRAFLFCLGIKGLEPSRFISPNPLYIWHEFWLLVKQSGEKTCSVCRTRKKRSQSGCFLLGFCETKKNTGTYHFSPMNCHSITIYSHQLLIFYYEPHELQFRYQNPHVVSQDR